MRARGLTETLVIACAAVIVPSLASAGQPPPLPGSDGSRPVVAHDPQGAAMDPVVAARFQLAKMEGLLEVAVEHGAVMVSRQWRTVMPDMLMMGGNARARGFRLDGYGVFFDVEVPALRQSMMWSWRVLERDSAGVSTALEILKNHLKTVTDPSERRDVDQAIRRLELQLTPLSASVLDASRAGAPQAGVAVPQAGVAVPVAGAQAGGAAPAQVAVPDDPSVAYTTQVKNSLIDTMLDYSQALTIGPDEYLTVAARDNQSGSLPGGDPYDTMTIIIRIKGRDLSDFRSGRISRDEALKRVEVREY